jgi:hypothetical protein
MPCTLCCRLPERIGPNLLALCVCLWLCAVFEYLAERYVQGMKSSFAKAKAPAPATIGTNPLGIVSHVTW